jgi:hypothetical protein
MKTLALLSAIVVSLLPLYSGAGEVKITTMVFKAPDSVKLPGQVRVISKSEWQQTLRTLAQTKGTDLFVTPAARTPSGKTARVNLPSTKPGSFWRRDDAAAFPVSRIDYTPKETPGGIELTGNFQLNPAAAHHLSRSETLTAAKVHGHIPRGKVMTFGLGGHLFVLEPSKVE